VPNGDGKEVTAGVTAFIGITGTNKIPEVLSQVLSPSLKFIWVHH